jgi:alpha-tubulin suppressor-like RCC1 family protein
LVCREYELIARLWLRFGCKFHRAILPQAWQRRKKRTMKSIGSFLIGIVIGGSLVAGLHAQTGVVGSFNNAVQSASPDSIVQLTAEAQGLSQMAPADLPRTGTYWLVMPSGFPAPAPCPPLDPGVPVYQMASGQFLVDETGGQVAVNQRRFGMQAQSRSGAVTSALEAQANTVLDLITRVQTAAANQQMRAMGMAIPSFNNIGDGSGGTNGFYSDSFNFHPDYGTNLWIAQVNLASGYLSGGLSNSALLVPYGIFTKQSLTDVAWSPAATFYGSIFTNLTPVAVPMLGRGDLFLWAKANLAPAIIGAGSSHFAVIRRDGTVWAWGDNYNGELGDGQWANSDTPVQVAGISNVVALAAPADGSFTLALDNAGEVWSWGANGSGQLGCGDELYQDENTAALVPGLSNIVAIAAGASHSIALKSDGTVWAWGANGYGQLGDNYAEDPRDYAALVPGLTNAISIASGANHIFALCADGTVWGWGYNETAGLGIGNDDDQYQPVWISSLTNAVALSGGYFHSIALLADGTVQAWGDNCYGYGEIGNISSETPVSVPGLSNIVAIASGGYHNLFLDANGNLFVWGNDDWNQMGDNGANDPTVPFQLTSVSNVTTIAGGATSSMISTGNGMIYVWGNSGDFSQSTPSPANLYSNYSSDGSGLPDWWEMQYFGHLGVDPNADAAGDGWSNLYKYQHGMIPTSFYTPPTPTGLTATENANPACVILTWNLSPGQVVDYRIFRSDVNPVTSSYASPQQIGEVGGNTISFVDNGSIAGGDENSVYQIVADYAGGASRLSVQTYINNVTRPATLNHNIYLTACLVRNGTGRWQVMFSGLPTSGAQTVQLTWMDDDGNTTQQDISTTNLINGIYPIPDSNAVNFMGDSLSTQLFGPEGEPGQIAQAGTLSSDAPYFVDGRQHMKQNLNFLLEAASIIEPFGNTMGDSYYRGRFGAHDPYAPAFNQTATNFEEFSFLRHDWYQPFPLPSSGPFSTLDNLWPFTANYDLANFLVSTTITNESPFGSTNFNFVPDFVSTVPAPPMLNSDPMWILQPSFECVAGSTQYTTTGNWGVALQNTQTVATLQSGLNNLFGLPYQTGCVVDWTGYSDYNLAYQFFNAGSSVTVNSGYTIGTRASSNDGYASQCPAPSLQPVNYYFAPLINPGLDAMNLPSTSQQPFPLPIDDAFNVTNQTPPVMVGSVGQPMILGGWAKYSIQNGASGKFAYLGQYFVTNAFLLDSNGHTTTNSAGVVSPYGEFFPTQTGQAQFVTMPDIDPPYEQGTGVVQIISMNVDANHDGTMDFSYSGPDQNSPSRPFRFWINDDTDSGDDTGNGIPGQGSQGDGVTVSGYDENNQPIYNVHGRRDLVDFFPVYLNIGGLFQSNALSVGISVTDTNWQFVLSQAGGTLRFAYTDLTPTNYMNFLLDTNESGSLASAQLTTITTTGIALTNTFLSGIALNNQGIILVEAWTNTTQPLVLTIYHGTNQVVQTKLYLSISGVEQLFRSKTLMLNSEPGTVADRIRDWDVPNEPDTTEQNVVFVHGYNVNPQQARGWFADIYKRLYWSGSHAKFYGVNWYGCDSQGDFLSGVTANYQTNVVHAFQTAPLLANFLATLTNGPTVVMAHSLGNMVALSALSDYGAPMSQYFMLDAAVPMEAIDGSIPMTNDMVYADSSGNWLIYSNWLWASEWYNLWPTNDARNTLTWSNRLANFGNTQVFNFYSSGEDVLRDYAGTPPGSLFTLLGAQLVQFIEGQSGLYVWAWQEKDKGRMSGNTILSSNHGGWRFGSALNPHSYTTYTVAMANAILPSQLQTNAFFDFGWNWNPLGGNYPDYDYLQVPDASGSDYAQANRNRILSDAIPALTLPIGANPVSSFARDHNIDMMTLENGWPLGRGAQNPAEAVNWHHSDIRVVAYPFTYNVFNEIVNDGNLR